MIIRHREAWKAWMRLELMAILVSYQAFSVRAGIPKLLSLLTLLSVSLFLLFFSIKEEMMILKEKYNLHVISHYKTSAKGVS